MNSLLRLSALLLPGLLLLGACGGSSGGPGDGDGGDALPGTFAALMLQGEALPGPTPGTFEGLSLAATGPLMDVAAGGWSGFVGPTSHASVLDAAFVVQPDGVVVEALARTQPLPAPSDGLVAGFERIFVTPGGILVALVTISGDSAGRTRGAIAITVSGGAPTAIVPIIYEEADVSPLGLTGTLATIFASDARVDEAGNFVFFGETSTGVRGLFRGTVDGVTFQALVTPGAVLPGGVNAVEVAAFGIDPAGGVFAFASSTTAGDERVYVGSPGVAVFDEIAREGELLPGGAGGTLADAWVEGPLLVYPERNVFWRGRGSLSGGDDLLLFGGLAGHAVMARTGDPAPSTSDGVFSALRLLAQESQALSPYFVTSVVSPTFGSAVATFRFVTTTDPPVVALFQNLSVAAPAGATLGASFPSLGRSPLRAAARNGTLAAANVVSTGESAVYWLLPADLVLAAVAVEGTDTPVGNTWAAFAPAAHVTTAQDAVQWAGTLADGRTGIFRRVR